MADSGRRFYRNLDFKALSRDCGRSLRGFVERYGYTTERIGAGFYMGRDTDTNGRLRKRSFTVYPKDGWWVDWSGDGPGGERGDAIDLIMAVAGVSKLQAIQIAMDLAGWRKPE